MIKVEIGTWEGFTFIQSSKAEKERARSKKLNRQQAAENIKNEVKLTSWQTHQWEKAKNAYYNGTIQNYPSREDFAELVKTK